MVDYAEEKMAAHRHQAAVGHRQRVLPSPLRRRRRRPTRTRRCSPTPPPRSSTPWRPPIGSGGANYVLWGGREGYETLLNTDLKHEAEQLARFLTLVAEHKHKIGFTGTLLLEPKPQEPTKHQYDYDSQSVHGFLDRFDLLDEYKVNLEVNHATLAGHSFHHEVAYAVDNGILGSIDANRGDHQNGWDTDQFPNSVEELSLAVYEILRGGGLGSGGFNFDTKLRRQSMDRMDLFHGHIGGIDTLAQSLLVAADMIEQETLTGARAERYAGWSGDLGAGILSGRESLASLEAKVAAGEVDPDPVSGRQEFLENRVNQVIWKRRRLSRGLRPRHRHLDDGHQGDPRRRSRGGGRRGVVRVSASRLPSRCGPNRKPGCGGRPPSRRSRPCSPRPE